MENKDIVFIGLVIIAICLSMVSIFLVVLNKPATVDLSGIDENSRVIKMNTNDIIGLKNDVIGLKGLVGSSSQYVSKSRVDELENEVEDLQSRDSYYVDIRWCVRNSDNSTQFFNCLK